MSRITPEIAAFVAEVQKILPIVKITGSLSLLAFGVLAPSRTIGDVDFCIDEWTSETLQALEKAGFTCEESEYIFDDDGGFLCCAKKNGIKADFFKHRQKGAELNSVELQGIYSYPIFAIRAKKAMLHYLEGLPTPTEKERKSISKHQLDIEYFLTHSHHSIKI